MSVLVAVLYAFSRLAAENEVTALKASGVSPWRLVTPALVAGAGDVALPARVQRPGAAAGEPSAQDAAGRHLADEADLPAQGAGDQRDPGGEVLPQGGEDRPEHVEDARGRDLRSRRSDAPPDDLRRQRRASRSRRTGATWRWSCTTARCSRWRRRSRASSTGCSTSTTGSRSATWRRCRERSKSTIENRGDRELGICAMQKRLRIANASYLDARADYEEALRLAKLPTSAHAEGDVGPSEAARSRSSRTTSRSCTARGCRGVDRREEGGSRRRTYGAAASRRVCVQSCRTPCGSARCRTARRGATARRRRDSSTQRRRPTRRARSKMVILGTSRPPARRYARCRATSGARAATAGAGTRSGNR